MAAIMAGWQCNNASIGVHSRRHRLPRSTARSRFAGSLEAASEHCLIFPALQGATFQGHGLYQHRKFHHEGTKATKIPGGPRFVAFVSSWLKLGCIDHHLRSASSTNRAATPQASFLNPGPVVGDLPEGCSSASHCGRAHANPA
jgi:hypothetical protein